MKKWLTIVGSIIIVGIGAFFLVNTFIKSGVPALDHAFTRGFIDTSADTGEEGFYLFESGTGEFTMHYPGNFEMHESQGRYSISSDRLEIFNFQKVRGSEDDGLASRFKIIYKGNLDGHDPRDIDFNKMLEELSFEGQYETFETENKMIRYGESVGEYSEADRKTIISDPNEGTTTRYFAFVEDKHSDKFIRIAFTLNCQINEEKNCTFDEDMNSKLFNHIINSVKFN